MKKVTVGVEQNSVFSAPWNNIPTYRPVKSVVHFPGQATSDHQNKDNYAQKLAEITSQWGNSPGHNHRMTWQRQ
ncbi:hypothetical protein PSI22_09185 [Xenorhabdus sp. XENO-7]|uniref:Uncharacterized protein n=1 Tax=Xenorhabdus aichiensis TaxID=3025874 RepID=A0ABT5M2A0_9GAMM|nr:hypothetical protein [Xenorhabdus aichiensis]MDC9621804.1 hypothetical protein [Xenorhabdus aichiensis]